MSYPTKDIANTIYHSAVITSLAVGYAMIGRKLIKLDVGDPARPDMSEVLKLTVVITLSTITKDWLVNNKIIPADIVNKTI
jgi:energy-converting hydrogenase Eha subunit G